MSRSPSKRRTVVWVLGVPIAVLALLYGGHLALLWVGATEGDVPAASVVPLPSGAMILSEEKECASGGCWTALLVEPPDGESAEELATTIGATPQLRIAGSVFDPRTINVRAEADGRLLELRLDYWSQEYVP